MGQQLAGTRKNIRTCSPWNTWDTSSRPRTTPGENIHPCKLQTAQTQLWRTSTFLEAFVTLGRHVIYQSLFASSTTDMESFYSCLQKTAKTTVSAWTHEQSHCKRITACTRVYKMHVIIQITLHTSFMKAWSVGFKWKLVSLKAPQRCQQLKWFHWNKHNKPCSFFASYFFILVQQPIFFFFF